ncbi:VPLPA-CTERM sorting domain-containing protein [Oceanicoccus sagamiensis]|uniref:Uncharacterized protein n=1 Tax=Oceanicoccus sagamiensis TaxID=716816 RepID=A0A1X9NEA6_9GAMM|nr:VPLPA-CTERM sorting domain-containing protein [Oceanicoccus sagamiensis]ARN75384.1 hypothetical protein BST96_15450 [Oceanicoccus sagamiensis]
MTTFTLNLSALRPLLAAPRFLLLVLILLPSLANAVVVKGSNTLTIDDALEDFLLAKRDSSVDIISGGVLQQAIVRHNATLTVDGGSVDKIVVSGAGQLNVITGSFTRIVAKKDSRVSLSNVANLDRLVLRGNAAIEIMASELEFDGRFLTGVWENGTGFSIRTINRTGVETNGLPGFAFSPVPPTAVPVPATAWLFLSALTGLGLIGRRRH